MLTHDRSRPTETLAQNLQDYKG